MADLGMDVPHVPTSPPRGYRTGARQDPRGRATFSTAGSYNLILALWLRSLSDLETFERQLTTKAPHITVADRAVVIRTVKLIGRILDAAGHATDVVAYDPRVSRDDE
jgi:hypothetical protein